MLRRLFISVLFFIFFSNALWARFSNNYQQPIGNRASGMGGAFVALADDSTALWYNPAGLSQLDDFDINVTASTYSYIKKKTTGFLEFERLDGTLIPLDLNQSEFAVTPSTLAFGRSLGKNMGWGFGLFVPFQQNLTSKLEGEVTDSNGDNIKIRSEEILKEKLMQGMVGIGYSLNKSLSIGIAASAGLYTEDEKESNTWFEKDTDGDQSLFHNYEEEKSNLIGGSLSAGTKLNFGANHSIGLQAVSPLFTVGGKTTVEELDFNINEDNATSSNDITTTTTNSKAGGRLRPGRVALGYAFSLANNFALSTEAEMIFPYDSIGKSVINAKVGLEKYFGPRKVLRLGAFTDFSQEDVVTTNSVSKVDVDFYGASVSYSFAHTLEIVEADKKTDKYFWTTFGLLARTGSGKEQTSRYTADFVKQTQVKNISMLNFKAFVASSVTF